MEVFFVYAAAACSLQHSKALGHGANLTVSQKTLKTIGKQRFLQGSPVPQPVHREYAHGAKARRSEASTSSSPSSGEAWGGRGNPRKSLENQENTPKINICPKVV